MFFKKWNLYLFIYLFIGYVGKEVIAIPIVPDPYSHKTFWQILFQILFCFSLLYFIVVEIQEFLLLRVKYFTIGIWNWADMLNIFLFIFSIVRWVQYTTNDYVKNFEEIILSKFEDEFFDLYEIAILFRNISDYASLCVFVSVLRVRFNLMINFHDQSWINIFLKHEHLDLQISSS